MSRAVAPGSTSALREQNLHRVLACLAEEPMRQAELARRTGLSAATVSGLVRDLAAAHEVVIHDGVANGRRGKVVSLAHVEAIPGIGVDLGRSYLRLVLGTGLHEILEEEYISLEGEPAPAEIVSFAAARIRDLCTRVGIDPSELSGLGLAIPAPVDVSTGKVVPGAILSPWDDTPVRDILERELGIIPAVDNDANMGAVALDRETGSEQGVVYLKVASGIGAGVMIDGRLIHGASNAAGELGHLNFDPNSATVCRCGRRGCLETLSSTESIRAALEHALREPVTFEDTIRLVREGNPVAVTLVSEAGNALGRGLAMVAMALNPARIVIGGPLAAAGEPLLEAIQAGLDRAVLPMMFARAQVEFSAFGDQTEAYGALEAGLAARCADPGR